MKVCQLCAVDFTLQHFLLPLIDGMRDVGWEVIAVCSNGPAVADLRTRGYRVATVSIARSLNLLAHPRSLLELIRLFRRERFDIVHAHTPVAAMLARIAARIAGVPIVIYTAHGFYFHDEMPPLKRRAFVLIERFGGWFTDFVFTQSQEDASAASMEKIMPADQVLAIGNGVDVARFDPAQVGDSAELRASLGIPSGAFVIGMIGRLVREKGVVEFLDAACRLADECPSAYFLLVGDRLVSDHATGVSAEINAAQATLGKQLILTGLRTDIPELLAAMDVFCLPSWREGMPRTIIEAMMMGKPVVATDIRGAREEVVPEKTGLLVPTRRPQELAGAMARLIADPTWGAALGLAGRERALRLYDERHVVRIQLARIRLLAQERGLLG